MHNNFNRRQTLVAIAAGTATLGLNAIGSPASAGDAAKTVSMNDKLQFTPATLTVHPGDEVVWHNASQLVHTVTADPALAATASSTQLPAGAKPFNSGNLEPGGTFRHVFTTPGTYKYFCIPHEAAGMTGQVVVQA
jgi:plastocyanin